MTPVRGSANAAGQTAASRHADRMDDQRQPARRCADARTPVLAAATSGVLPARLLTALPNTIYTYAVYEVAPPNFTAAEAGSGRGAAVSRSC